MSEHANNTEYIDDAERYEKIIRAFNLIGELALNQVEDSYGRGIDLEAILNGDFSSALEPDSDFPFHGLVHSNNVGETVRILAEWFGLSPHETALAVAAARAHDVIRKGKIGDDEGESAEWFESHAQAYEEIDDNDTEAGSLGIYATIPTVSQLDFMLIDQHVNTMKKEEVFERTSRPERAELIADIIATADLGELFQPTGPLMSHMLLYEIKKRKPTIEELIEFQRTQVAMLYTYEHPLGDRTPAFLLEYKKAVINYSEKLLYRMVTGQVSSWKDVIESDCNFIIRCKQLAANSPEASA